MYYALIGNCVESLARELKKGPNTNRNENLETGREKGKTGGTNGRSGMKEKGTRRIETDNMTVGHQHFVSRKSNCKPSSPSVYATEHSEGLNNNSRISLVLAI